MKEVYSREYLNAYIDGELTNDERLAFLRQLEHDPELKAEACALRTLKGWSKVAIRRSSRVARSIQADDIVSSRDRASPRCSCSGVG